MIWSTDYPHLFHYNTRLKMSSESEYSESSASSTKDSSSEADEDYQVFNSHQYAPYEDEPLADLEDEDQHGEENEETEADLDGLTASILEARYEKAVEVESWCQCQHCKVEHLVGALEYRCCREVVDTVGKMAFDGSIEKIKCKTEHEDYKAMSNETVLLQVGPLLKHRDGSTYKKRTGSQNEFIRATAYRWIIRWLCGYMGWENTRPLPACIYNDIRTRYSTGSASGYQDAK